MGKSYRHEPRCGITKSESEKDWKRQYNRGLRRNNNLIDPEEEDAIYLDKDDQVNQYDGPKDGKCRITDPNSSELRK